MVVSPLWWSPSPCAERGAGCGLWCTEPVSSRASGARIRSAYYAAPTAQQLERRQGHDARAPTARLRRASRRLLAGCDRLARRAHASARDSGTGTSRADRSRRSSRSRVSGRTHSRSTLPTLALRRRRASRPAIEAVSKRGIAEAFGLVHGQRATMTAPVELPVRLRCQLASLHGQKHPLFALHPLCGSQP